MLIVAGDLRTAESGILKYIPPGLHRNLYTLDLDGLEEIRIRAGLPVCLVFHNDVCFLSPRGGVTHNSSTALRATAQDIENAMELLCSASVYAHEQEIKNGFITVENGHRVGLCGSAVIRRGKISFIKNISGLNYRLARAAEGAADPVIDAVYNNGNPRSTLIISPPGQGKTTLLRDLTRLLSKKGVPVSVVDERREIAALQKGVPSFDLGCFTDVIESCSKAEGMELMIRSMRPQVLVTDEIGAAEDIQAITTAARQGVRTIATIHGTDYAQLKKNPAMRRLLPCFSCFISLNNKKIKDVTCL